MADVFIVIYCVCCITIMAMCATSVVYMIHDMLVDSRADKPVDNGEDAAEEPVDNGEDVTNDA